MHGRNFRFTLTSMLMMAIITVLPAWAQETSREYKVKAAFIYNFAQFGEWPDSAFAAPDASFVVVVVGKDPFNGLLERAVSGKMIGKRRAVVQHIDSIDQIGACQILFIPAMDDDSVAQILNKVQNRPVLTIGENENFSVLGGGCRFFTTEDNRLRFEVNLDAVEGAGLKMSSKLLKLARIFRK
jgi:hypothetical protein